MSTIAVPIADATQLPRPDMSGSAVAMRIAQADAPPQPPRYDTPPNLPNLPYAPSTTGSMPVEPSACPPELFIPTSPRRVRFTNSGFPTTRALCLKYNLPLGAVVQPMAETEDPIPVVNFGSAGIVRCRNCRSYINFSCKFLDGGRRWKCSLCGTMNDVPVDYFAPLDQYGKRKDAAERPELHRGSIEFVAPVEYMVRPPMPPVYMFLLETTPTTINSGVLATALTSIRNSINSMPNEGRTRIAIITFDTAVHFYLLRPGPDAEPSVYVVSDVEDVFLPTPDEILSQLSDCRPCFEKTLDYISRTYTASETRISSPSCLGAALKGAQKAMELIGGKIVIVTSSRPTMGPGALRDRADNSILGTDRERAVLRPETSFYRELAVSMSKAQIGCDFFICVPPPTHHIDLASLLPAAKFTGGEIFYCPNFNAAVDAPRLQLAINRTLARESGLEAVMRIRAAKGVRCTKFSGRFFVRSADLLAMPGVDSDKAYAVQFNIEDMTMADQPFCLQVALLYTTTSGERRIRVHTVALPLVNNLHDLLTRIDTPTTNNILVRLAAESVKDRNLDELRKSLRDKLVNALVKYKDACSNYYATTGSTGSSILMTEAMQLMPLFIHGIGRCPLLSRDVCSALMYRFDDKTALVHEVDTMNVAQTSALVYPNCMAVIPWPHVDNRPVKHPHGLAPMFGSLRPDIGILMDDGRRITLWLGERIAQYFLSELFGTASVPYTDPGVLGVELMRRGSNTGGTVGVVFSAVKAIVSCRKPSTAVHIVCQQDQNSRGRIESLMCEERTASLLNYHDFMRDLQRSILRTS